jgi:membrane protein
VGSENRLSSPSKRGTKRIGSIETRPTHGENLSGWWSIARETVSQWSAHNASRLGAALAYYSIFSLGPLLVIAISIAGLIFGADASRNAVVAQLRSLLGDSGAQAVNAMLAGATGHSTAGIAATILGVGTLVFAAIGMVIQLKDGLNTLWDVKPPATRGIWGFARTYFVSLAGVVGIGFLLLVSMLLSTALAGMGKYLSPLMPASIFQLIDFAVSFMVITALFAMMFKWLPDTTIAWRDVWMGAAITALLFDVGKFAIGLYIGRQGLESTYGAAASVVIVIIWVYYSAQIVFLGAQFTHVYALRHGSHRGRVAALTQGEDEASEDTVMIDPWITVIAGLFLGLYFGSGWRRRPARASISMPPTKNVK